MHSTNESVPMISVIVPVKNGSTHIRDLLDSLERLDYPKDRLEVLVVDGNSTDSTKEVVSEYPVKLLTEERPGINAARNTGLKHSTGEIVAFTDADCVNICETARDMRSDLENLGAKLYKTHRVYRKSI